MANNKNIEDFISKRPKIVAAYGYGSGVFKQSGYSSKDKPQLDLILVVDDLKKWHTENMGLNPRDYSFIGRLFFKYGKIESLKGNTGIAYISNIKENGNVYKYGTIEEKDLIRNLSNWDSFYLPGRFQKACMVVKSSKKLEQAIHYNREQALYISLLTLGEGKKDLIDLYTNLCGLSYLGDTRMKFAENPDKVKNIAMGSYEQLKELYGTQNKYFKVDKKEKITIDKAKLLENLNSLPSSLKNYIGDDINGNDITIIRSKIQEYLTIRNKEESTKQTKKGLLTNGIVRSLKYAGAKVAKKFKK